MLKVYIDRKNKSVRTVVAGSGKLSEIINDIATVINGMYSQLMRGGPQRGCRGVPQIHGDAPCGSGKHSVRGMRGCRRNVHRAGGQRG